jgi:hypothetical protein
MENSNYNGWTNYATWRINLEIFDGFTLEPNETPKDAHQLASEIKDFAEGLLELDCGNTLTLDYAMAFLNEVNWYEIANSILLNNSMEAA